MTQSLTTDTIDSTESLKADLADEEGGASTAPQFFNYHEFVLTYYRSNENEPDNEHDALNGLCVTHFANIYVPKGSRKYEETRIVRIPRRFDTVVHTPYFSSALPGGEPAAITDNNGFFFVPCGIYNNQWFGKSSVSPLSNLISQEEWSEVISGINSCLKVAYDASEYRNVTTLILDFFTLNLWSSVERRLFKHPLQRLEEHIESLNESELLKTKNIKIISPRKSSYLSVCTTND